MTSVYKITNLITGNFYIGCSSFLEARVKSHFSNLRSNKHLSKLMQKDFNLHGESSFSVETIKTFKDKESALIYESTSINYNGATYNNQISKNKSLIAPDKLVIEIKHTKKQVILLAAEFNKDIRTIRKWIKENNPMLTHPQSLKIINNESVKIKTA